MKRSLTDRTDLSKAIPISCPMVIHVEVTNICNYRCSFCILNDNGEYKRIPTGMMDLELFKKIIDDLQALEGTVKTMSFHLLGEPTLNPQFVEMADYASKSGKIQNLVLFTNGYKLTPELGKKLIDAGVKRFQFSIEHVSSEGYKKIVGRDVDYNTIINNIKSLYDYNKSVGEKCFIGAKILDCDLTDEEKNKFELDFKGITNECHIENLIQTVPEEYMDSTLGKGQKTTWEGYKIKKKTVCTQPFYVLGITWDGKVSPCTCDPYRKTIVGDVKKESLKDIWTGDKLTKVRKLQLMGERYTHPYCGKCTAILNQIDDIDDAAEELLKRID